jgi:type 1 glutamine amidotransferase
MMRYMTIWMAALGLCVSMVTGCATVNADTTGKGKKVVFVAGTPSHAPGDHEHRAGTMLLAKKLMEALPDVEAVTTHYGYPEDTSIFDGADTIVVYCDGGGNHLLNNHVDEFQKYMDAGVGLVCIHYAVETTKGEKGDKFLEWLGGYFEPHWSVNPHWEANYTALPNHAITSGVPPFVNNDEWYFHMRFVPNMKGVTPILTALPPKSTMSRPDGAHSGNPHVRKAIEKGEPQHMAWAYEREGGGRSFGFTGGHFHRNWQDDNFRTLVLNAIAWTANIDVPAEGLTTATPTDAEMKANLDDKKR